MASERVRRRIDRLLDQIEEAVDQRAWERVQALANDVLTLDPQNRDALAFLAAAERGSGRPGAAPLTPTTADVASTERAPTPVPNAPSAELRARPELVEGTSFAGGRYQLLLPDPDRIQPTLQGRLVLNYVTAELLSA